MKEQNKIVKELRSIKWSMLVLTCFIMSYLSENVFISLSLIALAFYIIFKGHVKGNKE